jgi:hypothetical protein
LLAALPVGVVLSMFGYALPRGLSNSFVTRPEHTQFKLLGAIAIILVNTQGALVLRGRLWRSLYARLRC